MTGNPNQALADMIACLDMEIGEWSRDFDAFVAEVDALGERIQAWFERGETA